MKNEIINNFFTILKKFKYESIHFILKIYEKVMTLLNLKKKDQERKKQSNGNFIIRTIDDKKKTDFEVVYQNIRQKRLIIEKLRDKSKELKFFDLYSLEARLVDKDITNLEKQVSDLWDIFRGKIKKIPNNIVYIPMTFDLAINYLSFLMNDDMVIHEDDIRCVLNAIRNEPGLCKESKDNKLYTRLKDNYNYIREKMRRKSDGTGSN